MTRIAVFPTCPSNGHQAAAKLWGIDGPELAAIQLALEDMKKVKPGVKAAEEEEEE